MPAPVVHTVESAISDPPSPSVYAASVRSAVVPDYDSTAAAPAPDVARFKKTRGSEFISGIITAPIELRDRYNNAIKRLESPTIKSTQYDGVCSGSKSKAQTPTVTKTSHAAKPSSLRNRIWQDDGKLERPSSLILLNERFEQADLGDARGVCSCIGSCVRNVGASVVEPIEEDLDKTVLPLFELSIPDSAVLSVSVSNKGSA
ncbi:hypothetical protein SNOG_00632 [Parastagonospora nodorum SN15]|uniref:Uncharacterized protein n=1 Tax=Phaeosphaeria nodorum (strain SN15 / ATCC MYA-4574 / FGSC 10173) TaxID=321614 RepID=Q0V5T2_PHANO|nr:hypothetical protein SNOG_00632 [Parastagonospora nodorum SN15]EAT92127.2 hypothetical protein SNOG_00632 [Parastagonospora nodorum SN15]